MARERLRRKCRSGIISPCSRTIPACCYPRFPGISHYFPLKKCRNPWWPCNTAVDLAPPDVSRAPLSDSPAARLSKRIMNQGISCRAAQASANSEVFTKHETRITAFYPPRCPVHHCSRLFTIVRYCSAKKYCPGKCPRASGVLVGPHGWPACLTTRRTQNELMPGKENVLDGANRRTFDIALTLLGWYFVRHEGRRSPTIRSQARTGAQT